MTSRQLPGLSLGKIRNPTNRKGLVRAGPGALPWQTLASEAERNLASGPHLHYEYRINGVHRNPRTVKLPDAAPVEPAYRADFIATAKPLWAQLDVIRQTQLARVPAGPDNDES